VRSYPPLHRWNHRRDVFIDRYFYIYVGENSVDDLGYRAGEDYWDNVLEDIENLEKGNSNWQMEQLLD